MVNNIKMSPILLPLLKIKILSWLRFVALFFILYFVSEKSAFSQFSDYSVKGQIMDQHNKPISFATVVLLLGDNEYDKITTDESGRFDIRDNFIALDSIEIRISATNKSSLEQIIHKSKSLKLLIFKLLNLSLTLDEIIVNSQVRHINSASSIFFDEEAIRQMQAFSLMDVLNALPGRKTVAPDLQSPQTITMRTSATGVDAMNNSFGIAIFIDGIRMNNETNMQSRAVSSRGLSGSQLSGYQQSTSDVAFNGFDLRDIPMSNIATIEVIQGIGSSRYGDFTNGAILITTKAGRTPYTFTTNINGGSSNFSLSKGLDLPKKYGSINYNIGYTNSNNDPRDKVKSYNNINGSVRWSKQLGKIINNSFSINVESNLDNTKADPDDDAQKKSHSKRRNLRFANNTSIQFKNGFVDNLNIGLSYSYGIQQSYTQWLLNGLPKGIANKDTTGVYEGFYIPGNYLAVEEIDGKPIAYSANVDLQSRNQKWFGLAHKFSFGFSYNVSANKGKGNIVDPNRPRWVDLNSQNERPYNYKNNVDDAINFGAYVQDDIRGKLFSKNYTLNLGFRWNQQNGRGNPQPRLSFNYHLSKQWSISTSYGISFKSPSLAHMYPAPTYFDIPLLNVYTGYTSNSVYLVYTEKVPAVNDKIKQAVTYQFEQGINYADKKVGTASIFAYYKSNKNGYATYKEYIPITVPNYNYSVSMDGYLSYFPTGTNTTYYNFSRNRIANALNSKDYGFQYSIQTNTIGAIATSFALRGGYSVSRYTNGAPTTVSDVTDMNALKEGYIYVRYENSQRTSRNAVFTINTNTHIPKIGFVVSLIADYEPMLAQKWDANNIYPIAYAKTDLKEITLTKAESQSESLAFLRKTPTDESSYIASSGFWNLNLRVAKEIQKKIRLSMSAFNFLNFKPKSYKVSSDGLAIYSYDPISITIGASFQF